MSARHHTDISSYVGPTSAFQSDRRRTAPFLQQVSTSALCRLLISGRHQADIWPTLVKYQNDIGFTSDWHRIPAIYSFLFIVSINSNMILAVTLYHTCVFSSVSQIKFTDDNKVVHCTYLFVTTNIFFLQMHFHSKSTKTTLLSVPQKFNVLSTSPYNDFKHHLQAKHQVNSCDLNESFI